MGTPTTVSQLLNRLRLRVVEGPGELGQDARRAAFEGRAVPEEARTYVEKVRRHAYRVTDADVIALRSRGWSEEAIFELTAATALGAALSRLHAAELAMKAAT